MNVFSLLINTMGAIILMVIALFVFPLAYLVICASWLIGKPTEFNYICPKTWTRQYMTYRWFKRM